MTPLQQYDYRHKDIKDKLTATAKSKINNGKFMDACSAIADKLEVSTQTVYNYITGRISDGYLADAILREIKNYKTK